MKNTIITTRKSRDDASRVAAQAARDAGTKLAGNLRWYGCYSPAYREAPTADGRTIRVQEPPEPATPAGGER